MVQLLDSSGNPLKASDTAHRTASHRSRELSSWLPPLGSADSDLLGELPTLVSRSRDLTRNHGVAAGAMQTLSDNVVGTGLRLSATPDYKALGKDKAWADEWARDVESQWRAWAESTACDAANSLNFAGLTSLVFRSSLINGEALALPLWLDKRGNDFATTIQLVEADRLSNPIELLRIDAQIAERAVLRLITVPLTDGQFDALVSFTYNLGSGALQRSTLRRVINRHHHNEVPNQLMRWVWAGGRKLRGLARRRAAEGNVYLL